MITLLYMLAFMLIPIWIPIIGAICGSIHDRLARTRKSDTLDRVRSGVTS